MLGRSICNVLHGLTPVIVMVVAQAILSGVNIFYKLAVNDGMTPRILIAYRFMFATLFISPIAFFMERKKRPKLTWTIVLQGFLSGLLGGAVSQNLVIESIALTSVTLTTAFTNLIPALTFILALFLRVERLSIKTRAGIAKLMGTLRGIGGGMVIAFYKGRELKLWSTNINLLKHINNHNSHHHHPQNDRLLGSLLAFLASLCFAGWYIIQAKMMKKYPCKFSVTALMCGASMIQSTIYALCMDTHHWNAWKLGWNIRLGAIAYVGILATGVGLTAVGWSVQTMGPLSASMFGPLLLIFAAIMGTLVLDEKLTLGSVIGSVLIMVGLYAVLYGKRKEMKDMARLAPAESPGYEQQIVEVTVVSPVDRDDQRQPKA